MTQKYALRCQNCNETSPIEPRHAGSTINCAQCSKPIEVPKLRELKQLELIQTQEKSRPKRGWGQLSGSLFSLGLLMLAIAIGSSIYLWMLRSDYQRYTDEPNVENFQFNLDIQQVTLNESWRLWDELLKRKDLDMRRKPNHLLARDEVKRLDNFLYLFASLATVGLVSMISALAFRTKQT